VGGEVAALVLLAAAAVAEVVSPERPFGLEVAPSASLPPSGARCGDSLPLVPLQRGELTAELLDGLRELDHIMVSERIFAVENELVLIERAAEPRQGAGIAVLGKVDRPEADLGFELVEK